ncbi:MAG TPA: hypothetical protein VFA34_07010 [Actinomycetota bacterium]|jgi:hypothetical protein|nr:hypothetical protein [Actinomycetota bacterium]
MSIDDTLDRAETAVAQGRGLKGTGFWGAVDSVRRDRALAERYADRVAAIDRRAFERGVRLRVPIGIGASGLLLGTLFGFAVIAIAFFFIWDGSLCGFAEPCTPTLAGGALFLVGFAAVLVCTHCLVHLVVGRALGIRFTHVFLGGPPPPRPGLKIDYASYLRTPAKARAVMHASGAIFTKLVPFAFLIPAVMLYFGWSWLTWLLLVIGVGQIVTDITLSTKVSDWKKVKRELRAAS